MHDTMADKPQKQTAATESTPGQKPAGAGIKPPVTRDNTQTAPYDLETLLADELAETDVVEKPDEELDPELTRSKPKGQGKQASSPEEEEDEPESEESDEDAEEEESESESEEAGEEEEGDTETEAEIGDEDEVDPEKPPKGFENVPKGIWKRQNKLLQKQRELKAQLAKGAIQVTPTPQNPLADVEDLETFTSRVQTAKQLRDWFKANPEGGSFTLSSGKTVELDASSAAAQAAKAEAIIEAAPDVKVRILKREETKPWEAAQKLEPTLFDKENQDHRFLKDLLSKAPGLAEHPEWELIAAYALKGYRIVNEEGSKKARYVRYELDANGKLIAPKAKTGDGKQAAAKPAPKAAPKAPHVPAAKKPALSARPQPAAQKPAYEGGDADVAASLAAELGDF